MGQTETTGQTDGARQVRDCLAKWESTFGRRSMAAALGVAAARGRHAMASAQMQAQAQATAREIMKEVMSRASVDPVIADGQRRIEERERLLGILSKMAFAESAFSRTVPNLQRKAGAWIYTEELAGMRQRQQLIEEAIAGLRKLAAVDYVDAAIHEVIHQHAQNVAWYLGGHKWGLPDPGSVGLDSDLENFLSRAEKCLMLMLKWKWGMRCLWPLLGGLDRARRGLRDDLQGQADRCEVRLQQLRELGMGGEAVEKHYASLYAWLASQEAPSPAITLMPDPSYFR